MQIRRMELDDLARLELQPSQQLQFGVPTQFSAGERAALVAQPLAYSMVDGDRVLACVGVAESFPGKAGVAWAMLSCPIGHHHLRLTRFVRAQIAGSALHRIEAITRAADIEPTLAVLPDLDAGQLLAAVMTRPTPDMRWAMAVGLRPAAVLRKFGADAQTCVLMERIA